MAMKDIKSIEVAPEDEERTTQLWMSFGWELKNNQRVKTQDVQKFTGQDKDGTEHYQTTRGVDFIKLTFERDPERKTTPSLKRLKSSIPLRCRASKPNPLAIDPKNPVFFLLS